MCVITGSIRRTVDTDRTHCSYDRRTHLLLCLLHTITSTQLDYHQPLSLFLSVCLSVCLFVCLSVCLSRSLSVHVFKTCYKSCNNYRKCSVTPAFCEVTVLCTLSSSFVYCCWMYWRRWFAKVKLLWKYVKHSWQMSVHYTHETNGLCSLVWSSIVAYCLLITLSNCYVL